MNYRPKANIRKHLENTQNSSQRAALVSFKAAIINAGNLEVYSTSKF